MLARPSAGIGVVEVQKPMFFLRFLKFPRDPLRGSAWSRCKNPWFFPISDMPARPSAGIGVVEVQKPMVFAISNMPARPSAGTGVVEVQKPMVFAISNMPARPSAGTGVVEVQKPMVFCDFCSACATLCGDRRGRGAKTEGFLRFLRRFFAIFVVRTVLPEPAGPGFDSSLVRGRSSQDATCIF